MPCPLTVPCHTCVKAVVLSRPVRAALEEIPRLTVTVMPQGLLLLLDM